VYTIPHGVGLFVVLQILFILSDKKLLSQPIIDIINYLCNYQVVTKRVPNFTYYVKVNIGIRCS